MPCAPHLLLVGTGPVGLTVIELSRGTRKITASTRNPNRIFELANLPVEPLILPMASAEIIESLSGQTDILVSFPPDGASDAIMAPACAAARKIIYISCTSVYGKDAEKIDNTSLPDFQDESIRPRLEAESIWREHGAIVLRATSIYGPESGLHRQLARGACKLPADSKHVISHIHVEDLSRIILATFQSQKIWDGIYPVGDEDPDTLSEVVNWLCQEMDLPLPQTATPGEACPFYPGRGAVDSRRIRQELGLSLKYASYREGYKQCLRRQKLSS